MFFCGFASGPANPFNSDVNYHLNLYVHDRWMDPGYMDE